MPSWHRVLCETITAVAYQSGDIPTIAGRYLGDAAMIGGDDVAQVLWIEPYGQFSRANEVAEHDSELAALGLGGGSGGCGSSGRRFSSGRLFSSG